ncbi:MAG: AraC family transcriptional regulator [Alistipes sp.]|nr:AraC family transcriptional regulator [Alistipes sp.]
MGGNMFISNNDRIVARRSSLAALHNRPLSIDGGVIILCTAGRAVVSLNMCRYELSTGVEMIVLPRSVISVEEADGDFEVIALSFTRECYDEANFRIEAQFFHYIYNNPVYHHTAGSADIARKLLEVICNTYEDRDNRFRDAIMTGYLRNILLGIYDKVQRNYLYDNVATGRREELFHRFIDMVMAHCTDRRDVAWYASELCISKSYLAGITRSVAGKTPKEIIDEHIIQEIKLMLSVSTNTIQHIADAMHFPDQSYLGRYFKHHTGQSPSEYRSLL